MNYELVKRILTSLTLLPVLIYCTYNSGLYFIIFLSAIYFFSFYEIFKNTKSLLFNVTSNIIIIFALLSFYYLRADTNSSLAILYWVLLSTFLSDIGGYISGNIFKGRKLTKISPNKTISGSVGSIVFSCMSLPILNFLQEILLAEKLVNFYQLKYFLITILFSIVCQFGDLFVSFWKRKIEVKNISNILPGHGGVLDRIDGLIFVLIFSFLIKKIGLI
ncbi:phosphatidate cytidylyltransferase [Pelagibacteraceae bacterium]|nr:phosphatidate cytidylyltransferase [Pelagibacteraceae bacterium]